MHEGEKKKMTIKRYFYLCTSKCLYKKNTSRTLFLFYNYRGAKLYGSQYTVSSLLLRGTSKMYTHHLICRIDSCVWTAGRHVPLHRYCIFSLHELKNGSNWGGEGKEALFQERKLLLIYLRWRPSTAHSLHKDSGSSCNAFIQLFTFQLCFV